MSASVRDQIRYVRPVVPVHFPATDPEWDLGQNTRHFDLCSLLRRILLAAVGEDGATGADQFVYFDASDPTRKCAPDAFVKLDSTPRELDSWKTWEDGVPELCVEILSPSDMEKLTLDQKLARYLAIGVQEVLVLDPALAPGTRLRAWDRVDGDLVERVVERERTPCVTLGLHWVLTFDDALATDALRLATDAEGEHLVLTRDEASTAAATAHANAERARADRAEAEAARLREELTRALRPRNE